ncbi:helix-turn-helix domain-containing protein [Cardinium endosymbiont of Tipula unca]|uniref:helix-turn-helix domain-containing protein n=1 Tax=Cardinium endosymbiont of Tipula unca TaxID=3066216 RepID=UPI0030D48E6B
MLLKAIYIAYMEQHKGKIVEEAIKKSGYQMKALAERLGIARNTLYTKIKEAELDDAFIIKIGSIIHYDFFIDFPHLSNCEIPHYNNNNNEEIQGAYRNPGSRNPDFIQLQELNRKYLRLLEDYNKLLKILILLANNNDLMGIKKEITEFLSDEEQDD